LVFKRGRPKRRKGERSVFWVSVREIERVLGSFTSPEEISWWENILSQFFFKQSESLKTLKILESQSVSEGSVWRVLSLKRTERNTEKSHCVIEILFLLQWFHFPNSNTLDWSWVTLSPAEVVSDWTLAYWKFQVVLVVSLSSFGLFGYYCGSIFWFLFGFWVIESFLGWRIAVLWLCEIPNSCWLPCWANCFYFLLISDFQVHNLNSPWCNCRFEWNETIFPEPCSFGMHMAVFDHLLSSIHI